MFKTVDKISQAAVFVGMVSYSVRERSMPKVVMLGSSGMGWLAAQYHNATKSTEQANIRFSSIQTMIN